MRRDGYISVSVLAVVVGLLVATDPGVASRTRLIGLTASILVLAITIYALSIPDVLRGVLGWALILLPVALVIGSRLVREEIESHTSASGEVGA